MNTRKFMRTVLGFDGYIVIATIKPADDGISQRFFSDMDEALKYVESRKENFNVFFGTGRFEASGNRKASNVLQQRALFVDLDCGDDVKKPFNDKAEALNALIKFLRKTKLPRPLIVDSGNGIHAYWPFNKTLSRDEWQPLADGFKKLCINHEFAIDTSVTSDSARILRCPGTFNLKHDNRKEVKILKEHERLITVEEINAMVEDLVPALKSKSLFGDDVEVLSLSKKNPTMDKLRGNMTNSFRKIMKKSVQGRGCNQIVHILTHQEEVDEPLWRAGLSIAKFCEDSDKAAIYLSDKHPEFSEKRTFEKMRPIEGPYTCKSFEDLNPEKCRNCPNFGKLKSPISLGADIIRAKPEPKKEVVNFVDEEGKETPMTQLQVTLPELPRGYANGKNGGIYKLPLGDDEDPELIYVNDFYVIRRILDPVMGETVMMRLDLPHDTPRQFNVPMSAMSSPDKFREELSRQGIAAMNYTKLRQLTTDWVNDLQSKASADKAARQFGWVDENCEAFVIGDRVIRKDNIEPNYPTRPTAQHMDTFSPKGTFKGWQDAMEFYNKPEQEAMQYVITLAFGSVLMTMVPSIHAVGHHIYSQDTGFGKTTAVKAGLSAWGDPTAQLLKAGDTQNSLFNKAEVLKDLPLAVDEFSNRSGKEGSDFLLAMTTGRQRNRLSRSGNEERHRGEPWNLTFISTANESFKSIVGGFKMKGLAEAARVMDAELFKVKGVTKKESDEYLKEQEAHWGHAGPLFVRYVMRNREAVRKLLELSRERVDNACNLTGQDRFHSAEVAIAVTVAFILKQAKILTFIEPKVMHEIGINYIQKNREARLETQATAIETLSDFVMEHWANFLVVAEGGYRDPSAILLPEAEARNKLVGRYEKKTRKLFVVKSVLKQWCGENRIDCDGMVGELVKLNDARELRTRITAGSKISMNPVKCVVVRYDDFDNEDDQDQS